MVKNQTKKVVLLSFMEEGIVLPSAFKTLTDNKSYIPSLLTNLTDEGYICNRRITVKSQNRKYAVTYKAICPKGVQWLIDNCSDEYPWLRYLPNPVPKFVLTNVPSSENLNRFLKSISASIIFSNFGIKTFKRSVRTNTLSAKSVNFQKMVSEAKEQYEQDKIQHGIKTESNEKYEDIYFHSRDISQYFKLTEEEIQQHIFSSHIGLLISRGKSYFIYATSPRGIKFNGSSVKRARISVTHYLFTNSITNEQYGAVQRGIIFCKNSKEFELTFKTNKPVEKKKGFVKGESLKQIFQKLFLLPVCRESMYTLDEILTYQDDLHERAISELMRRDALFKKGKNSNFELMYNNCEAVIGIDMDIVKLQNVYDEITSDMNRDKTYVIICYEWQREYYERILPSNVKYYTVPIGFLP